MLSAEDELLSEQNKSTLQFIDFLTSPRLLSDPTLNIVDYSKYSLEQSFTQTTRRSLPPKFIIGFTYKPDINTVLRLFSIENTLPPAQTHTLSTLILSSTVTLVYPSMFFIPWNNITHYTSNHVLLYVNNGELSSCMNGEYLPYVWNTNLWLHNVSTAHLQLSFSKYLREVSDRVRRVDGWMNR